MDCSASPVIPGTAATTSKAGAFALGERSPFELHGTQRKFRCWMAPRRVSPP
jgi:hypothetical protein